MSPDTAADVIVVGAGPAGSILASLLAGGGVQVLVVDRAAFPRPKPCGDYLNPGCAAVLVRLGLRGLLEAAGARPVRGMRVVSERGSTVLPFLRGPGWALPRRTVDDLLLRHALSRGARFLEGWRVVAVTTGPRLAEVVAEDHRGQRRVAAAPVVVGADGLRSTVARSVGAGGPPRRGRFTVGTYLDGLSAPAHEDVGELHLGRDRYCGVAYLPGGLANVTVSLPPRALRGRRGPLEEAYWEALRSFPALAPRLDRVRRVASFATSGPLAFWRRRSGVGRVFLVGDAAASIDPLTGQGVYLALRGAELCAAAVGRVLGGAEGPEAAVRSYGRARCRELGAVLLASRILRPLALWPPAAGRALDQMEAHPDLAERFGAAMGNLEHPSAILRPAFVLRLLGGVGCAP